MPWVKFDTSVKIFLIKDAEEFCVKYIYSLFKYLSKDKLIFYYVLLEKTFVQNNLMIKLK